MPQIWCFGSMVTWNLSPSLCGTTDARTSHPDALHITRPSQYPLVDKPHLASITGTWPAVARRPGKVIAHVVWSCPSVAYCYNLQFSWDTLNQYNVQNQFPEVELIYYWRTNGIQPTKIHSTRKKINIFTITSIISIITIR